MGLDLSHGEINDIVQTMQWAKRNAGRRICFMEGISYRLIAQESAEVL